MNLTLIGHDDRYAVEQLQLALFPANTEGEALSTLHRGAKWLTATTKITLEGKTVRAAQRLAADGETVRLRRRALQRSYYLAAVQLLKEVPAWGALSGVRPTKISTKHLLEGGTPASADKLFRDAYFVTEDRRRLALDCSGSTVKAASLLQWFRTSRGSLHPPVSDNRYLQENVSGPFQSGHPQWQHQGPQYP